MKTITAIFIVNGSVFKNNALSKILILPVIDQFLNWTFFRSI